MSHQMPPPPPPGQYPYGTPMQPNPKPSRKRHRVRNTLLIVAGVFVLLVIIGVAVGGSSDSNSGQSSSVAAASSPSAAASSAEQPSSAPSSQGPQAPTEVEFVITGTVPAQEYGGVDIDYGSDSDSHQVTVNDVDGTLTYKVPFNSSAEFYSLDVNFQGGKVACKIVATGPGDNPLTVSHGTASGNAICSAQAAPENGGLSWDNEQ